MVGSRKDRRSNVTIRSRLKKLELALVPGRLRKRPPRGIDCEGMSLDEIYTRVEGAYPEGWEEYIGKIAEEIDRFVKEDGQKRTLFGFHDVAFWTPGRLASLTEGDPTFGPSVLCGIPPGKHALTTVPGLSAGPASQLPTILGAVPGLR